jgi:hypothetical protein
MSITAAGSIGRGRQPQEVAFWSGIALWVASVILGASALFQRAENGPGA